MRTAVLLILTLAALGSCASSPALATFPQRYIDRSVLLPAGVSSWIVPTSMSLGRDEWGTPTYQLPLPYPLVWQSTLNDNWTVNWSPLPFSVNRRVHQSPTSSAALQFGLHPDNSPVYGVSTAASLAYITQHKISENFALSWSPRVEPNFFFRPGPLAFNLGLQIHATNQILDTLAVIYGLDIEGKYFSKVTEFALNAYNLKFFYPLLVEARFAATKQWEVAVGVVYDKLGRAGDYENYSGRLTVFHYW